MNTSAVTPASKLQTVRLLRDDMLRYVRAAKHDPTFIDLPVSLKLLQIRRDDQHRKVNKIIKAAGIA